MITNTTNYYYDDGGKTRQEARQNSDSGHDSEDYYDRMDEMETSTDDWI